MYLYTESTKFPCWIHNSPLELIKQLSLVNYNYMTTISKVLQGCMRITLCQFILVYTSQKKIIIVLTVEKRRLKKSSEACLKPNTLAVGESWKPLWCWGAYSKQMFWGRCKTLLVCMLSAVLRHIKEFSFLNLCLEGIMMALRNFDRVASPVQFTILNNIFW